MKKILILALIFLSAILSAQQVHRLQGFDMSIDGNTKENALINEMSLKAGTDFPDKESLEQAIARQEQDLINLRVFDKVELKLSENQVVGDDVISYRCSLKVKDSWTIYPIPYPKFETGEGFRLGVKIFYDNVLGTLNNVYLGTNITFKNFDDTGWENTKWSFNPQYNDVEIGDIEYDFSLMQQKDYIERKEDEEYLKRYNFYNTDFNVSTTFKMGDENQYFYRINPGIGLNYAYEGDGYNEDKEPFYVSFSHGGGYSQVDWIGNFRKGFSATAKNSIKFINRSDSSNEFTSNISGEMRYFTIPLDRLNFSNRLYGIVSFNDDIDNLGSNIRGVEPSSMFGINGLFLSNDFNIAVIRWNGVGEAQFQPFFDIGFSQKEGESLNMDDDLRYGTGADFILYLDKLKGLHARGTLAVDLSDGRSFSDLDKYEIIITSSLSY